ncbi:MAG: formylglycine-generating enzyme family protein [Spirochaetaceae bacterium]|jgi:formylglycine-generating enzyme required for sulfatase activity|nr:formylglycine-generating enzyme family protein [Spirochaetaceae bacterium]
MKNIIIRVIFLFLYASCTRPDGLSKEMIKVEGGSFAMGNAEFDDENPAHKVTLDGFYMAKYLVTVEEWKEFLADTNLAYEWDWQDHDMDFPFSEIIPSDDCPAQGLNWYYAIAYCNWLSERDGLKPCYTIKGEVFYSIVYDEKDLPVVTWNKPPRRRGANKFAAGEQDPTDGINRGRNQAIMEKCPLIKEYVEYIYIVEAEQELVIKENPLLTRAQARELRGRHKGRPRGSLGRRYGKRPEGRA